MKLLKSNMDKVGVINGIKVFIYICMQNKWGRKVYSIQHKKFGKQPFYMRSCSSDDAIVGSILKANGGYDFLYLMQDTIKSSNNILDGGANIGAFSRIIHAINPNAKIIAVELEESNCEMVKMNMKFSNTEILHGAIWNKDEKLSIQNHEVGHEAGFCVDVNNKGKGVVNGYTIDMIFDKYNIEKLDIVKLDVEGAEIEIFDDSSEKWLDRVNILIVELHDRHRMGCSVAVYGRLQKHGYRCKNYGENVIFYKDIKDLGRMK